MNHTDRKQDVIIVGATLNSGEWDAYTLESWIVQHVRTADAREFARIISRAVLCIESHHISYLFFLEYLRQGQGVRTLTDVEGGAPQTRFC